MSCCGDRRAQLARSGLRAGPYVPTVTSARQPTGVIALNYHGPVPMALRGPFSKTIYRLEANGSVLVEAGDVAAMIRTGWFDRAS